MYNKLILIGRLGKNPEARGKERSVVSLDVATTNYYVKKDGQAVEEVEWTSCVAFGKLAESILKNSMKGDLVLVEGMKKTDIYEKDGVKKMAAYLQVDTYRRLSWNKEAEKLAKSEQSLGNAKPLEEPVKILID